MLVTASWGGAEVAVDVDPECRTVAALKRCLQEVLPELDVEAVCLEVGGRSVDDEAVLSLAEGSVIDVSATQAALATATLREGGFVVDFDGFYRAAEADNVYLCKLYLETGVVWCSGAESPLHIAARHGFRELCELFLESGCEKDAKDKFNYTSLHRAINSGKAQTVRLLFESGCDKEAKTDRGYTPLHFAVSQGMMQLAELLIGSGCVRSAKDNSGMTPLHYCEDTKLHEYLLSRGCV